MRYDRVAPLYDAYVTTTFDIPFLVQEAQRASGHVLELMAGTGRVTVPLAQAGVDVTAVDRSPAMLALLRRKLAEHALAVDVREMDVRAFALPRAFELVLIPFHSFSELVSRSDQMDTLAAVRRHLSPQGKLICPLHNPAIRLQSVQDQFRLLGKQPTPEGDVILLWGQESYDVDTRTVRGVEFFERYGADETMQTRVMVDVAFHLFDRGEFEGLATAAGFQVLALYGDYSYAPFDEQSSPFMIWVLEKAARTPG